jgi:hypothetical protein
MVLDLDLVLVLDLVLDLDRFFKKAVQVQDQV